MSARTGKLPSDLDGPPSSDFLDQPLGTLFIVVYHLLANGYFGYVSLWIGAGTSLSLSAKRGRPGKF